MKKIAGKYQQITEFTNENAGTSEWCLAVFEDQQFFAKKLLTPVYPGSNVEMSDDDRKKRIDYFHGVELKYASMYKSLKVNDTSGVVLVPDVIVRHDNRICTIAECFSGNIKHSEIYKLSQWQRLLIIKTLNLGLMNVHAANIVHADMKPDNILVHQNYNNGMCHLRLIDFDGSYFVDKAPNDPDNINGDMGYWAPEIIAKFEQGDEIVIDEKIDLFALGIIFHYLWCGKAPYISEEMLIGQYVHEGGIPEIDTSIHPEIASIIRELLSKDPNARPSCVQINERLSKLLQAFPKKIEILVPPPPHPPIGYPPIGDGDGEWYRGAVRVEYLNEKGKIIESSTKFIERTSENPRVYIYSKKLSGYTVIGETFAVVEFDEAGRLDTRTVRFVCRKNYDFLKVLIAIIILILIFFFLPIAPRAAEVEGNTGRCTENCSAINESSLLSEPDCKKLYDIHAENVDSPDLWR